MPNSSRGKSRSDHEVFPPGKPAGAFFEGGPLPSVPRFNSNRGVVIMKQKLTRRAALAGLAAATTTPAIGAGEPDPIYAAIATHREAFQIFNDAVTAYGVEEKKWSYGEDEPATLLEADERVKETSDEEAAALEELVTTVPITFAGTLALIRYVLSYEAGPRRHHLLEEDELVAFLTTIGGAIEKLANVA